MTWPVADSPDAQLLRTPGVQVIDPEYDELFMDSYTLALAAVTDINGCPELAEDMVEDALREVGVSWLYVVRSEEFVRALSVAVLLEHLFKTERAARYTALAEERQQGRSRSSAHDVRLEPGEWLEGYLLDLSAERRERFDESIGCLTTEDLAGLIGMKVRQLPRVMARRWNANTPKEES